MFRKNRKCENVSTLTRNLYHLNDILRLLSMFPTADQYVKKCVKGPIQYATRFHMNIHENSFDIFDINLCL